MKYVKGKLLLMFILIVFVLSLNGEFRPSFDLEQFSSAEAVVGRPATPVSYAGVARRSSVGVGRAGNRGGPVNRVGRR